MKRRQPINSASGAVAAMAAAAQKVEAPACVSLRAGDEPFWDAVVRARAASEWNEADLIIAAGLARALADVERWSAEIEDEGDTLENARGTMVANPKHALMEQAARRIMALRRDLQIHGYASNGEASVVGARRAMTKAVEADSPMGNDLLARPPASIQ